MNPQISLQGKRVLVTGHQGMAGSAIVRRLQSEDCVVLTIPRHHDLRDQRIVAGAIYPAKPDVIFHAAGKVGGIVANSGNPVEFLRDNALIAINVIEAANAANAKRLVFLGSSCIYPRDAVQPITEESLLTGPLEPTNESYAIAKIAGVKLCDAYFDQFGRCYNSVMPTNLYGPGDSYHPLNSHVPAALIRRFHQAKVSGASKVYVWGSGTPRREFMHVDDFADACVFAAKNWTEKGLLNIGTGADVTIAEFASLVAEVIGYSGEIVFDRLMPDGAPRKNLDVSKINALGWRHKIGLKEGLSDAYRSFAVAEAA